MPSAFFDPDDFEVATPAPRATVTTPAPAPAQVSAASVPPIAAPVDAQPVTVQPAAEKPKFFELKPVAPQVAPEPIRMPEPLDLPTEFPSFAAPAGFEVDLSDLPIGSEEPLTRRQLREMQRLTGSDVIAEVAEPELEVETELPYEGDLVEQVPQLEATDFEVPAATSDDFSYLNNQIEAMFDVSPGLMVEPTTNSIVIDQVQDLTNYTATISETGEILTTGAIQLPIELTDNSTGEVAIIQEAAALDSAIQVDNATGFINTIAPMRVTGVVNAISKFKVIPTNLKRGSSHPYLVLAAAVGMVALGSLVVAAFWLKII
jgi:hypothetical protein